MKPERIEELMSLTPDAMCEEATDAELLHLLRCARVVAELEAWFSAEKRFDRTMEITGGFRAIRQGVSVTLYQGGHHGTTQDVVTDLHDADILTATEAALAKAKETSRG